MIQAAKREILLYYPRPWPGETMSGRIPYALLMLYQHLRERYEVRIVDQRTAESLEAEIERMSPETLCVGISSFTGVQIRNGLDFAGMVRAKYPEVPIVWGGWHPSCAPEQTLGHDLVDIVVRGQGEHTFRHVAETLDNGGNLAEVQGISYKDGGKLLHNPEREYENVPMGFCDTFDKIDVEKYVYEKPFAGKAKRTIGVLTSLGCPYNCAFCSVACVYKRRVYYRAIDTVLEEIEYFVHNHRITSITFDDDNFFTSRKRVLEICDKLIERKIDITWDAGVSVDLLLNHYTDEDLALIHRSGCEQLYIGAESGSDEVLRMLNKNARVEQTYQFVAKMKEVGIKASLSSMVGLPGVPEDEVFSTMDMILKCREINPEFDYRIFFYTPYPSTQLYDAALEHGMLEPGSLEQWSEHTLRRFKAPWLSKACRNQVKYFCYYYFPYSNGKMAKQRAKLGDKIYGMIFENRLLQGLAAWRTKKRCYAMPIDAAFAVSGMRLKTWWDRKVNKNINAFYEYDH